MILRRSRRRLFLSAAALVAFAPLSPAVRADVPMSPAPVAAAPPPAPALPPLPPIFQPPPIPLGRGLLVGGALDLRTRTATTGRRGGLWVNTAELDFQHPITSRGQARGNVVLQLIGEDPPDIRHGQDVQLGEAYLLYRLPTDTGAGTTAFLKAGQFQLPFGLLAVYDPHLHIVQPLYSQSLGLRTEWGMALTGRLYGYLQYDLAVTTGTGPNHADVDPNRLVTFRLGRTFVTRNGVVTVGGSLLSGRLPVTDLDARHPYAVELPPSGRVRIDRFDADGKQFTAKTRIAADVTYAFQAATLRGEAMVGADGNNRVQGYYGEGDYGFSRRASALAAYSLFVYPVGNSTASRGSAGLTYHLGRETSVSAVYEYLRDVPRDSGAQVRHRLTFQALFRF